MAGLALCRSLAHAIVAGSCFTGDLEAAGNLSFTASVAFCEAQGGYLAAPHTEEAWDTVTSMLPNLTDVSLVEVCLVLGASQR